MSEDRGPKRDAPAGAALDEAGRVLAAESEKLIARSRSRPPSVTPEPPFRPSRLKRYRDFFVAEAVRLIEQGAIEMKTNGRPIRLRLRVFSDGSALFDHEHGSGGGMAKLTAESITPELIAFFLENACLNARVRPER